MKSSYLIILLALSVILSSCEKTIDNKPDIHEDLEAPKVEIIQPDSVSYHQNKLRVRARITENDELHGLELMMVDLRDSSEFFYMHQHHHGQEYTLDTLIGLPTKIADTHVLISIIASDHNGNEAEAHKVIEVQ